MNPKTAETTMPRRRLPIACTSVPTAAITSTRPKPPWIPSRRLPGRMAQGTLGPTTYSARRGHPRLRLRHQPFAIGQAERDAWLAHMTAAVESLGLQPEVRKALIDYFETTSTAMINVGGPAGETLVNPSA